jgi:hypothetical protein
MKLTKLLALLIVLALALSACTKSALRKDLLEYVKFNDTMKKAEWSAFEQADELLLGDLTPFEHHKEELLDTTAEVLEKWRTFKMKDKRMQNLIDLKVQEWELRYAAYEKADETMLVANYSTWEEFISQDMEIYQRDFQRVLDKYDSLVDGKFSAVQEVYDDAYGFLMEKTDFRNSKEWKEIRGDTPMLE